jgi:hypothetical protein
MEIYNKKKKIKLKVKKFTKKNKILSKNVNRAKQENNRIR